MDDIVSGIEKAKKYAKIVPTDKAPQCSSIEALFISPYSYKPRIMKIIIDQQSTLRQEYEAIEWLNGYSDRTILTIMAVLNALVWRAAINYDVSFKKDTSPTGAKWGRFIMASQNGDIQISQAMKFTAKYVKAHWPSAFHARCTMIEYRGKLENRGFFTVSTARPKHTASPASLERLDVVKCLITYQVADSILRARASYRLRNDNNNKTSFDCMPSHGGMFMVCAYNHLFSKVKDFRGNLQSGCGFGSQSITIDCPDDYFPDERKKVVWKFPKGSSLSRAAWQRMVINAGELYEGLVESFERSLKKVVSEIMEHLIPF